MPVLTCQHTVLPDGAGLRIAPATLHIEDGLIHTVEEGLDPAADEDLGHRLLSPAFIDAHTHLALIGLRGVGVDAANAGNVVEDLFFRVERRLTPEDVRALVRVGAYEALLHGTVTVWDHYYHPHAVVQGLQDVGICGVIAPALQDLDGPGIPWLDHHLQATADLHASAPPGFGVALGPHATDTVSDDLWARVIELATGLDLPVHAHLAQSIAEVRRAHEAGFETPLQRLDHTGILDTGLRLLLVHGLYLTDSDLVKLDRTLHTLALCPASQAQFGFVAPASSWEAMGLDWVIATDGAATNDSHNLLKELRAVAALRTDGLGTSPDHKRWRASERLREAERVEDARQRFFRGRARLGDPSHLLSRVWRVPGQLHPRVPTGEIRAGALAHLVAWDLDHVAFWPGADPLRTLTYGDASPAIDGVMVHGAWRTPLGAHASTLHHEEGWKQARQEASDRLATLLA